MNVSRQTGTIEQQRLVRELLNNFKNQQDSSSIKLVETHISWVLLAGRYAYKIKKAVKLEFLDFSSLQARRLYCEEELRLNRRLAPKVYLNVIAIGGSPETPVLDEGPAIEYAVRMRRFPVSKQFDQLAVKNQLLPGHIDNLAATISQFHSNLRAVDEHSTFGTATAVHHAAQQNFVQIRLLLTSPAVVELVAALNRASENEFSACRSVFEQRLNQGFVRECHGDLHLGNIVLMGEQAVPFDGIEFNPALRWIDVISEIAFTVMDLQYHQRAGLAFRFLNAYLETTGDYAGVRVLRFYLAYRALVRAKVYAIRAAQVGLPIHEATVVQASSHNLLALAADYFVRKKPVLIITHGLPGSGKTTFSQIALERFQAIRIRSDVERKRLYAVAPLADSRAKTGINLYSAEITQQTYSRLLTLTRTLLEAGYTVIVDAAFVDQTAREPFRMLAEELKLAFVVASIHAGNETMRKRIAQRLQAGNDASEADFAVLETLQQKQQPLSQQERVCNIDFVNEGESLTDVQSGWGMLDSIITSQSVIQSD